MVLITGAGSGQGAAEAVALAEEGALVIATDLRFLDQTPVPGIEQLVLDVLRRPTPAGGGGLRQRTPGRLDALVNNAAVPFHAPLLEVALSDWER